jgi:outer membrane protein assembly factor BamB
VAWLPDRLPDSKAILWSTRMSSSVLAGVAATRDAIVVADRDPADRVDTFRCYNADGTERWTLRYPAPGNLDYGNSARATPLIQGEFVYLVGAQGHVHAVSLADGQIRWKKHLQRDFGGPDNLSWGFCASPLIADGRLILQPGGPQASLVALDPATGDVLWKSPGKPPGHSSPVFAEVAGHKQVIAYDEDSLGGWDPASGKRLWTLKPKLPGDFNVPTPVALGQNLILVTENNGARLHRWDAGGVPGAQPAAEFDELAPDCESPVLVGRRLFGAGGGSLFCLDAESDMAEIWRSSDETFREYTSLIASPDRVLVTSLRGKLLLVSARGDKFEKLGELQLFDGEAGLYSHPAIVGNRLYVRGSKALVCVDLDQMD